MSVRLIHGDALAVLRTLEPDSIDCCVTSPPYWALRDYGFAGQIGLEPSPEAWCARLVEVFDEVRRVLKPSGTLWVNVGDSYAGSGRGGSPDPTRSTLQGGRETQEASAVKRRMPMGGPGWGMPVDADLGEPQDDRATQQEPAVKRRMVKGRRRDREPQPASDRRGPGCKPKDLIGQPWMLAFALRAAGWWLRSDIIWHKRNPMPENTRDRPTRAHEYVFLLSKGPRYYYGYDELLEPASENTHARVAKGATAMPPIGGVKAPGANGRAKYSGNRPEFRTVPSAPKAQGVNAGGPRALMPEQNASFDAAVSGPVTVRNARSVWSMSTEPSSEQHFAAFPRELARRCIVGGCPAGGVVLDPFAGTGTVGEVAVKLGRRAVLIEGSCEYVRIIRRRLAREVPLLMGGAA